MAVASTVPVPFADHHDTQVDPDCNDGKEVGQRRDAYDAAAKVVELSADIGVKLTPAGATYPYGHDPEDRNIRIAPTFPSLEDLGLAMNVFVVCLELATINKMLSD